VHWPYSLDFLESFAAAQLGAALLLTALLLFWRSGSVAARWLMFSAIWIAAYAGSLERIFAPFEHKVEPESFQHVLALAALGGTISAALARRPIVALVGLVGEVPLWLVSSFVKDSDSELAALHLAWLGLLVGLLMRRGWSRAAQIGSHDEEGSYAAHDAIVFLMASGLAALVCVFVLERHDGVADEWAYTYQAAVFAKGHVFAHSPRCQPFLDNFYVFETSGRLFAQYTPGWPFFIVPFVWMRAIWLSGPASMGLMAVGMARLARSAMRCFGRRDAPPSASAVRAAGTWGAVLSTLGPMTLVNGASRYPHVFAVGLYAWTLEAVFMLASGPVGAPPPGSHKSVLTHAERWGLVLGTAATLDVATRPADGAFVGFGAALWFLYLIARRLLARGDRAQGGAIRERGSMGWRAFAAALSATVVWSTVVLVILRLQMGRWFVTGYSLNELIHPWNVLKYSKPDPAQWKFGLPLATGAYCWWPCSMALGLAGLALLRGRALGCVVAMALGCLPYIGYMEYVDLGQRGFDWGYGPRYLMVLLVPMTIGGAVALAPLTVAARRLGGASALSRGAPLALAVVAVAAVWLRAAPLVWPTVTAHVRRHAGVTRALEKAHLSSAVVIVRAGTTGFSPEDLTTNLPIDLYPNQDVLIALDRDPPGSAATCFQTAFPDRRIYMAQGVDPVVITPLGH
jgi:hypothetical protein